jgi:hypothetical protein
MASSWEKVTVDNSNMPLYLSVPESGGPVPGIVVVHGQSGLENFIKDATHMLALQGYVAAAPNLYHRDPPDCKDDNPTRKSRLRDAGIINDINAAIGFLKNHSRVNGGRLGIVGFCMGTDRLSDVGGEQGFESRRNVLWRRHDDPLRRGSIAIRSNARDQLPDSGALRCGRQESITGRYAQARCRTFSLQ